MTDDHPPRQEDDEDVPEERTGRGQWTADELFQQMSDAADRVTFNGDIPPGARTMRNLRDRKRIIE